MLNKKSFQSMHKELKAFDDKREEVISKSRDIITISKRIIYSIHRREIKEQLITEIKKKLKALPKQRFDTDINSVAEQEVVEALCFYEFTKNKPLSSAKALNVSTPNYLMGLCDLTGELARKAVNDTIRKDFQSVIKIRDFVNDIYGEFLKFDLRNGDLRKKSDSIKWNLKKIEDVLYDIKTKGMLD